MKRFANLSALVGLMALAMQSTLTAATLFCDDFEGYPFSDPWTRKWNAINEPANNGLRPDPVNGNNHVLKLFGEPNWSASATHAVPFTDDFVLGVRVWNGTEPRAPGWGRGSVAIENVTTLFTFYADGNLNLGGIILPFQAERWYDVQVHYRHNSGNPVAQYWLDNNYVGQASLSLLNPNIALTRLELNAGSTAYFDDVCVNSIPEPTALLLTGLGVATAGCFSTVVGRRRHSLESIVSPSNR